MKIEIKETCSCGAVMEYSHEHKDWVDRPDYAVNQKQVNFHNAHQACRTVLHATHADKRLPIVNEDPKWSPVKDAYTGDPIVKDPVTTCYVNEADVKDGFTRTHNTIEELGRGNINNEKT